MGRKKTPTWEKDLFELWWAFLKLSEGYKRWLDSEAGDFRAFLQEWRSITEIPEGGLVWPARFSTDMKWQNVWYAFGDVHKGSFEEWWGNRQAREGESVGEYSEWDWARDYLWHLWHNMKGRPSDPDELGKRFIETILRDTKSHHRLFLVADLNADLDKLTRDFRALVVKQKQEREPRLWSHRSFPIRLTVPQSITRARIEDYRAYLETYREHQKQKTKNWQKIMAKIRPGLKSPERTFYHYMARAEELIRNAEALRFPG